MHCFTRFILIIFTVIPLLPTCLADTAKPNQKNFSGIIDSLATQQDSTENRRFYIGFGVSGANFTLKNKYIDNGVTSFLGTSGFNSVGGELLLGYGKRLKQSYYLGGELSYNYQPIGGGKAKNDPDSDWLDTVHNYHTFAAVAKGGYFILPKALLYLSMGADYSKFESKVHDDSNGTYNLSNWGIGFQPGLGAALQISDSITVNMHYAYTFYPEFSDDFQESDHTIDTFKLKPTANKFGLDILYYFN